MAFKSENIPFNLKTITIKGVKSLGEVTAREVAVDSQRNHFVWKLIARKETLLGFSSSFCEYS
jgi:hypothetical protein